MEKQLIALLKEAISLDATDIHFKVEQGEVSLQFRTRQEMVDVNNSLCSLRLFRYLQYRSNLDVSEVLLPQTGQFEVEINKKIYSLRFALLHSFSIISGVLRILNADFSLRIDDLTFNKKKITFLKKMIQQKSGLILLSGPTGSGKTTTLYTLLNSLDKRKIFTLEDPIEIYNHRYVQLQINEKQNLDYQEGIKQLLRHDPDVLVIGEIRDEIAASMAVRSALTGHLVISTIHATDCSGAILRMLDLNVSENHLKDVCLCVSNQRLYTKKNKKGKIGVYEIMSKAQLKQLFNKEEISGFTTLHDEIAQGIKKGFLSIKETKHDKI